MLYNGVEVQTIKLVLSGTESTGISSKQVLLNCIVYLTETYRESREFSYLEKAVWHMYAYLELGFSYADGEEIFQTVLDDNLFRSYLQIIFPVLGRSDKFLPYHNFQFYFPLSLQSPLTHLPEDAPNVYQFHFFVSFLHMQLHK